MTDLSGVSGRPTTSCRSPREASIDSTTYGRYVVHVTKLRHGRCGNGWHPAAGDQIVDSAARTR